jgi:hypothetical protein
LSVLSAWLPSGATLATDDATSDEIVEQPGFSSAFHPSAKKGLRRRYKSLAENITGASKGAI